MKIKDRPEYNVKSEPMTFAPDTTVKAAVGAMCKKGYGSVVVVNDDNTVAGMFTERDVMTRVVDKKKDIAKTKLKTVMTKKVRTAKADDDVIDWLRIMSEERFRHLPVVDKDGKLVCLMSQGDFVSYTWPDLLTTMTEKAKESLGIGYQIALIVTALVVWALFVYNAGF